MRITELLKTFIRAILPPRRVDALYNLIVKLRLLLELCLRRRSFSKGDFDILKTMFRLDKIAMIPYPFVQKYNADDICVLHDLQSGLNYVEFNGKRLYYKRGMSESQIRKSFNNLLLEQDPESPHRYTDTVCDVCEGDVLVDAGASEGFFTLSVIERVSKAILVECEDDWHEAMRLTFAPWKDKCEFIAKYLSDHSDGGDNLSLDDLLAGRAVNFIKADIEGAEPRLLRGAPNTLSNAADLRVSICIYHTATDEAVIGKLLSEQGFKIWTSPHYMVLTETPPRKQPFIRRGVMRAEKHYELETQ